MRAETLKKEPAARYGPLRSGEPVGGGPWFRGPRRWRPEARLLRCGGQWERAVATGDPMPLRYAGGALKPRLLRSGGQWVAQGRGTVLAARFEARLLRCGGQWEKAVGNEGPDSTVLRRWRSEARLLRCGGQWEKAVGNGSPDSTVLRSRRPVRNGQSRGRWATEGKTARGRVTPPA
jgi:hypothetical protein